MVVQALVCLTYQRLFVLQNLLELMLNADTRGKGLSDDEIAAQSIGFLQAGSDTTSVTLSLACFFIAANPEVQEKLHQEIDCMCPEDEEIPSYDTVRELPYLDMVIAETLRLHPVGKERSLFSKFFFFYFLKVEQEGKVKRGSKNNCDER